jgi:hypothetical protein
MLNDEAANCGMTPRQSELLKYYAAAREKGNFELATGHLEMLLSCIIDEVANPSKALRVCGEMLRRRGERVVLHRAAGGVRTQGPVAPIINLTGRPDDQADLEPQHQTLAVASSEK